MNTIHRRRLLGAWSMLAGVSLVSLRTSAWATQAVNPNPDPWRGLNVGVATYTLRELPIEDAIKAVQRVGLKYLSIKNVKNHIDLSHSTEDRKQRAQMFRDAGLIPMSVGNVSMRSGETEIRKAFEYAKDIGVGTIVCAPSHEAIPVLDKLVKEYDIRLAIHNHGPEDKGFFPSPNDVMRAIEKSDPRIGMCIDVGHTARAGVDPAEAILRFKDRLYDLHIKDISAMGDKNTPIEAGRGILDLKSILSALLKIEYKGLVGFEYEKDGRDPLPGLAESVGYIKGLLASI